jgi:N-carbamoyl-L-amino-acid hydrolase
VHDPTPTDSRPESSVAGLLGEIATAGADPGRGGYTHPVHSAAETDLREWFIEHATRRALQ